MGFGNGWGFTHALFLVLNGLVAFFVVLVIAGLLFLLVRFLLHATTAAKIYVAKNSPASAATPPAATPAAPTPAPAAPAPTATTAPPTQSTPVAKPASKPRTPKAPPTA